MKHTSQKGFTSLTALLVTSLLLSLGGSGAVFAYGQKHPEDFRKELHQIFGIAMRELPKLPSIPTPSARVETEVTVEPTPMEKDQEEFHKNDETEIHENEKENDAEEHDDFSTRAEAKFSIGVY